MRRFPRTLLLLILALVAFAGNASAGAPPDWLVRAAAVPPTAADGKAAAVVLLDEEQMTIDGDGLIHSTRRFAVRVQTRDGRRAASVAELYLTDSGRIDSMKAWLLRPGAPSTEYGKDHVVDVALVNDDVYNEARARSLTAGADADPGTVFGAEIGSQSRQPFGQFEWRLQGLWPVRVARRSMTLPAGWTAASVTFNHPAIAAKITGATYVWEAGDLPAIAREPSAPGEGTVAARLAVTCLPPSDVAFWPALRDWQDVSKWLAGLSEPQAQPDDGVARKAREIAAAATTQIAKVRAIAAFVQHVRYVSIQTGIGRGGGYRPQPAAQVLARGYGDCKNKATLMRAMLAAVGVRTWLVSIYAGDSGYVRTEWPSAQQFNHAIVAVVLTEPFDAPAVVEGLALGRLLLVDPTDEDAAVGHLPPSEQDSLALVVAGERGALVRVPCSTPESNALERIVEAALDTNGTVSASVRERYVGGAAGYARAMLRGLSSSEYRDRLTAALNREFGAVTVDRIEANDHRDDDWLALEIHLVAPAYARALQQQMRIFRLPSYPEASLPSVASATREQPLLVDPLQVTERTSLTLPAGVRVDELPAAADITSRYGHFSLTWKAEGRRVTIERRLRLERASVLPADYQALRTFLERARTAQGAGLVLKADESSR